MARSTPDSRCSGCSGIGGPEFLGEVLFRSIREDRHDYSTLEAPGHVQCRRQRGARRNPREQALLAREPSDHLMRALALDPEILIGQRWIVNRMNDGRLHVLESLESMKRPARLKRVQLDLRVELPEMSSRP